MDTKIKVMVRDASVIHTQLLSGALRRDHGFEVSSCDSVHEGVGPVLERSFDVLVVSINLGEHSHGGLDLLREARVSRPLLRAVVLLDSSKPEAVLEAFRAGAKGVFSRQESLDKLCKCIRCVHEGQIWANGRETAIALEALASAPALHVVDANGLNLLSNREMEIVQCVAEGLTNRDIADRLQLSRHTIKNSLFRIFDKLGVSNRLELLLMTLSHASNPQSMFSSFLRGCENGALQDDCTMEECQQAAEQGSPVAQLLLAQLYATKNDPREIILAYKWYSIALAQLSQSTKKLRKRMTAEQLSHLEEMTVDWAKSSRKIPAASISAANFPALTHATDVGSD